MTLPPSPASAFVFSPAGDYAKNRGIVFVRVALAAFRAPRFDLITDTALHLDTAPQDITTGAVSTTTKSLRQADLIGLRMVMEGSLGPRDVGGLWAERELVNTIRNFFTRQKLQEVFTQLMPLTKSTRHGKSSDRK